MARWEVRSRTQTVQVEGANWLLAVGSSLSSLQLDARVISRLICDVQSDGVVRIMDPVSRTPLLVRRLPDDVTADGHRMVSPVGVVAAGARTPEEDTVELTPLASAEPTDEVDLTAPPPPLLHMPPPTDSPSAMVLPVPPTAPAVFTFDDISTLDEIRLPEAVTEEGRAFLAARAEALQAAAATAAAPAPAPEPALASRPPVVGQVPPDLAERLFIRGTDIADAPTIQDAARITLQVLDEFVAAEAKSVLYASINDTSLHFLAADGPSADAVANLTVPLGHGIAGFCFDTGAALIIRNAAADPRHLSGVDARTGYATRDMMSVALRDQDGGIHGCVQLINPPQHFTPWQLEAAITLTTTLGDYISMRS